MADTGWENIGWWRADMKLRLTDMVLLIVAIAVVAYLVSGMTTTWYPHTSAQEVEKQYLQQQEEAKRWP